MNGPRALELATHHAQFAAKVAAGEVDYSGTEEALVHAATSQAFAAIAHVHLDALLGAGIPLDGETAAAWRKAIVGAHRAEAST